MVVRSIFTALLLFLIVPAPVLAEQPSPSPTIAPTADAAETFDPAEATKEWLASVPAETRARSDAYFEGGYWLILWNFLLTAAILMFLLSSRTSARLRDFVEGLTSLRTLQVAFYAVAFTLVVSILSFPLYVYQSFFREHTYGLATQTFGPWFLEQLLALLVQLVQATVALIGFYAVFRSAPRTWWLWGAGLAILFLMIGLLIAPVFIEPLFNTYKPIDDPKIRDPILAMARANEIPVEQVFEVDASRQTTRVSANVAGFLGTTRIALNDNLLNQCTLPEIRAVMAHEMGHYVLNHGAKLTTYFGVFAFFGFGLAAAIFNRAVQHWGAKWDVHGIGDIAGFPLLVLIFVVFAFFLTPIINTTVRVTEREADVFGINASREPDGMAKVALKLGVYRKLDPTPLEEFIFYDHPSGRARIRMAMDWKAAHLPAGNLDAPEPATD